MGKSLLIAIWIFLLGAPLFANQTSLYFKPVELTIPLNHDRIIKLRGYPDPNFTVTVLNSKIAEITKVNRELKIVRIKGLSLGETTIIATEESGRRTEAKVIIKKLAGYIPDKLFIRVSGNPVPSPILIEIAKEAVQRNASIEPSASLIIKEKEVVAAPFLEEGKRTLLEVPAQIIGPDLFTVSKNVYVGALNEALGEKKDDYLMISNDPEIIEKEGILFKGELKNWQSSRLLYYHTGGVKSFNLITSIKNEGKSPIEIFLSKGISGPDPDSIFAGHVATQKFMKYLANDCGEIIKIKGMSQFNVASQEVSSKKGVATGIIRVWLLSGLKAILEVKAVGSEGGNPTLLSNLKEDGRVSGIFDTSTINIYKEYYAGRGPVDIRLGEEPVLANKKGFDLFLGNYGMLHRINIKLINNTPNTMERVSLHYVSQAGPTRGTFVINGRLYGTRLLDSNLRRSERLLALDLPPSTTKELKILMMPQPGSHYPTRLLLIGKTL